jgi:hypothetical protein
MSDRPRNRIGTMTQDPIERGATALFNAQMARARAAVGGDGSVWDLPWLRERWLERAREDARLVIAALHEPSEAMIEAGAKFIRTRARNDQGDAHALLSWRAMIDMLLLNPSTSSGGRGSGRR